MSAALVELEPVAQIEGAPGEAVRALARDDAGAFYLVEIQPSGERRILSDAVTPELAERAALAVMGGDTRVLTKHQTITSMAVFITSLIFLARRGEANSRAAMPGATGDDASERASGATPPGVPPVPPGGDLFS